MKPMPARLLQASLVASTSFLAITAIGGGVGLLMGMNAPSTNLLQGSPFSDFSLPGLVLLVVVGGSALTASVLTLRHHPSAPLSCALAGVLIFCFEFVEVLAIGSPPGIGRNLQIFYFLLGLAIMALAIVQFAGNRRGSAK
jgi:hypothetical protein